MDAQERRAVARQAADAIAGLSTTVEDVSKVVRRRVRAGLGPLGGFMDVIDAHHAAVHSSIRHVATGAGPVVGEVLYSTAKPATPMADRQGWVPYGAALAAAFGDRLDPALAPGMTLRRDGDIISPQDLPTGETLMVFVHGLAGTEMQWSPDFLALAPHAAIRYNTGRSISANGADLAALLDEIVTAAGVRRLILVGHSMGGLVARSAIHHGGDWVCTLSDLVTLGTPHAGAPLERFAARALAMGARLETAEPILRLGHLRSQGVKDLRFGSMTPDDWQDEVDREFIDNTVVIDLPNHAQHHAVVAYVHPVIGDGIVPRSSAEYDGAHITVLDGHHMVLVRDARVRQVLSRVLAGGL